MKSTGIFNNCYRVLFVFICILFGVMNSHGMRRYVNSQTKTSIAKEFKTEVSQTLGRIKKQFAYVLNNIKSDKNISYDFYLHIRSLSNDLNYLFCDLIHTSRDHNSLQICSNADLLLFKYLDNSCIEYGLLKMFKVIKVLRGRLKPAAYKTIRKIHNCLTCSVVLGARIGFNSVKSEIEHLITTRLQDKINAREISQDECIQIVKNFFHNANLDKQHRSEVNPVLEDPLRMLDSFKKRHKQCEKILKHAFLLHKKNKPNGLIPINMHFDTQFLFNLEFVDVE